MLNLAFNIEPTCLYYVKSYICFAAVMNFANSNHQCSDSTSKEEVIIKQLQLQLDERFSMIREAVI